MGFFKDFFGSNYTSLRTEIIKAKVDLVSELIVNLKAKNQWLHEENQDLKEENKELQKEVKELRKKLYK